MLAVPGACVESTQRKTGMIRCINIGVVRKKSKQCVPICFYIVIYNKKTVSFAKFSTFIAFF